MHRVRLFLIFTIINIAVNMEKGLFSKCISIHLLPVNTTLRYCIMSLRNLVNRRRHRVSLTFSRFSRIYYVFVCLFLARLKRNIIVIYHSLQVKGKAVFITGCDSGFGHALAKHLHKLGFTVFAGCLLKVFIKLTL